jgi:hypothetical protein
MLPTWRLGRAHATVGTEWTGSGCGGYSNWAGYNNNTKVCVGATYSSAYCGTDKWFKNGTFNSVIYTPQVACGDGTFDHRNAWRWTHNGTAYRCADGIACSQVTCSFVICSAANP